MQSEPMDPTIRVYQEDDTSPALDFPHYEPSRVESEARIPPAVEDACQKMHIGEPSLLSWLANSYMKGKHAHRNVDNSHLQPDEVVPNRVHLSDDEVFASSDLENHLLDSFWRNFYPLFPIVNKNELTSAWKLGTVSPVLKQSVLFAGAQHSHDAFFTNYRYVTKQDIKEHFYQTARKLYDQDVELDRLCIIQSMFMLQFHYGPVRGHRDTLWWAGAALNLAQVVGMHRSTKDTDMNPEEQRLWKKIWWALFVGSTIFQNPTTAHTESFWQIRDRQISSGMGKPMMADERYCDVEDLTLSDFVDGEPPETGPFMISLIKLAKIGMFELLLKTI